MQKRLVLDSYALIGYIEDEPFADRIEVLLKKAKKGDVNLILHAIQLGEVYYITFRKKGPSIADLAYSRIKSFPITVVDSIDEELLLVAATLKAKYPISFADSFAAATAKVKNCALLSGDPEFKPLEKNGDISMEWLTTQH